ncbi:DUF2913 domain-containing protein [Vibrio mytili]|nr:DUF2913 family protein [Vibrio mytili]
MKPLLSSEEKKRILFKDFSSTLLLHLEFIRLERAKPIVHTEINQLLSNHARKLLRLPRYKALNKKVKTLLVSSKSVSLELLFLSVINYEAPISDLEEYLLMVRRLERQFTTTVMLSNPVDIDLNYGGKNGFICVLSKDLNLSFSKSGALLETLSVLVKLSAYERNSLLKILRQFNRFSIDVAYQDDVFLRFNLSK